MDSNKKEIPSLKGASLNPKRITIMVMRSVGKIRSYKISRRLLFLSSMFIIAYLIASIFIINRYFDLRYNHSMQAEKLKTLETANAKTEKQLLQTKQHVAILEDFINNIQVQKEPENVPTEPVENRKGVIDQIAEEVYTETKEENEVPSVVKIEDFVFQKADGELNVDFRLVNALPEETAMEGYIHIIATDKEGNLFSEWNYSSNMLKNGYPSNYRKGQPFVIQRFKPYHRVFIFNTNTEFPSTIRILVYDRSGNQLLENRYKVENVS